MRAAALIRAIQSERKSRRRTRRPRADCIIARSTASTPRLKQFFRRPRNPRASLRTRLRRRRALKPLLTRIAQLSLLRKPVRERLLEMALVAALEHFAAAQVALALAALAQRQVVAAEGPAGLDLARPRRAEPLHRAPLRLQFRHRDRALLLCYGLRPPPVAGKADASPFGSGPDTSSRSVDQLLGASARCAAGEGAACARGVPFCVGGAPDGRAGAGGRGAAAAAGRGAAGCCGADPEAACCERCDCSQRGLGARIMNKRRPSRRAVCSTTATSLSSTEMRLRMAWPMSRWVISRPRNITVTRALFPSARNSRIAFALKL